MSVTVIGIKGFRYVAYIVPSGGWPQSLRKYPSCYIQSRNIKAKSLIFSPKERSAVLRVPLAHSYPVEPAERRAGGIDDCIVKNNYITSPRKSQTKVFGR